VPRQGADEQRSLPELLGLGLAPGRRRLGEQPVEDAAEENGMNSTCEAGLWNHEGMAPTSRPAITTRWPALRSSMAISAPELPAPTISTGPAGSCAGLRYSLECNWTIPVSSSPANAGSLGSW